MARLVWNRLMSPSSTVMAESRAQMPCSRDSSLRRVVAPGSGPGRVWCVENLPDIPKCTCMTCASGPSASLKK